MTNDGWAKTVPERALLALGVVFLGIFVAEVGFRGVSSDHALREFDADRTAAKSTAVSPVPDLATEAPDFTFWSETRIRGYRQSVPAAGRAPVAVIGIARLNLRVPVYEGTDEPALNRGAGWIAGTARPGEAGNIGIAGHRDSFFRGLKDLSSGDRIELSTIRESAVYTVDQIEIVSPTDISVLGPRAASSLTLVTCYPFYFVGEAPKRYILHASLERRESANSIERREEK